MEILISSGFSVMMVQYISICCISGCDFLMCQIWLNMFLMVDMVSIEVRISSILFMVEMCVDLVVNWLRQLRMVLVMFLGMRFLMKQVFSEVWKVENSGKVVNSVSVMVSIGISDRMVVKVRLLVICGRWFLCSCWLVKCNRLLNCLWVRLCIWDKEKCKEDICLILLEMLYLQMCCFIGVELGCMMVCRFVVGQMISLVIIV